MRWRTITVMRPEMVVDRMNNSIPSWENPTQIEMKAAFAPASGPRGANEETAGGRQGWPMAASLYLDGIADVRPADRVVVDGETFSVDSYPEQWEALYGIKRGTVVALSRFDG